ncbi:MAG: hypothetical protein WCZ27_03345 [Tissierellaceae bacterium]
MKSRIKVASFLIVLILALAVGCKPIKEAPLDDVPQEEEGQEDVETRVISPSEKMDLTHYILLDSTVLDFNGDGYEETIGLYTMAGRLPNGEIAWDDGQNWALIVHRKDEDFILFDQYVQLGGLGFFAYFQEGDFVISTILSGTANLTLVEYGYEDNSFVERVQFAAQGDINILHQIPFNYDKTSD